MAGLKDIQKRWIVERLACYDAPSDVSEAFQEEFGQAIDRRQVANYDASKPHARQRMAADLVRLFDEARAAFKANTDGLAIAQKTWRLKELERLARNASRAGNAVLAAALMEQAAKECGDAYTNRREVKGDLNLNTKQVIRIGDQEVAF